MRRPTSTRTCNEWCRDGVGNEVLSRQVTNSFCEREVVEWTTPTRIASKAGHSRHARSCALNLNASTHAGRLAVSVCHMLPPKLAFTTPDDAETDKRSMTEQVAIIFLYRNAINYSGSPRQQLPFVHHRTPSEATWIKRGSSSSGGYGRRHQRLRFFMKANRQSWVCNDSPSGKMKNFLDEDQVSFALAIFLLQTLCSPPVHIQRLMGRRQMS